MDLFHGEEQYSFALKARPLYEENYNNLFFINQRFLVLQVSTSYTAEL